MKNVNSLPSGLLNTLLMTLLETTKVLVYHVFIPFTTLCYDGAVYARAMYPSVYAYITSHSSVKWLNLSSHSQCYTVA